MTPCPDRVLPSTTVWFFQRETKQSLHTPHFTLHPSHSKLQTSHSTLHTSHSFLHTPNLTLHTSHFTLRSSHSKLKLHTPHFTLHTSHFSLLTASFTLQTSHFTLHTALFALQTETSHSTLHTSHFPLLPSHCTLHTALFTPHTSHCSKPTCNKKTLAPKWRKSANKSISQPSCSQSKTIYEIQLQKTLRMQPKQEATLTQPFQCDLQRLSCKTQENYAQWRRKL